MGSGSTLSLNFDGFTENADIPLSVAVKNAEGELVAASNATIKVVFDEEENVAVMILGERVAKYTLLDDETSVEHSFIARTNLPGNFTYVWAFGDGRTWSHTPGEGNPSGATITYNNITEDTVFTLSVSLLDSDGEPQGSDQVMIDVSKGEEPESIEDRVDYIKLCNEWYESGSGGAGTTKTVYHIDELPPGTSFDMRFDAFSIPDRFIVEYEGIEVYNSGWRGSQSNVTENPGLYPGGISGPGSGSVNTMFAKNQQNTFTVTVIGPESDTQWNYALRAECPPPAEDPQ